MDVKFKVHSVQHISTPMAADVQGQEVMAQVPAVEVELTTDSPISGSLTLRFFGEERAEAEALFQPDAEVTASFA